MENCVSEVILFEYSHRFLCKTIDRKLHIRSPSFETFARIRFLCILSGFLVKDRESDSSDCSAILIFARASVNPAPLLSFG
jgi:hypothetical protein